MKDYEMINKLKSDLRYCLEYDYLLQSSSGVELFNVNGIVCILNRDDNYCMVTNYCRDVLNNIEDILRNKMSGKTVLINFNVPSHMCEEDIQYLNENHYLFHSTYNSYINYHNSVCNKNLISENHIVELSVHNINCFTYNDCNEEIQYRPTFKTLVDTFIRKNNGRIIAYVDNNSILGYLSYQNIYEGVNDVDFIFVANKYRNIGLGTLLGRYYAEISKRENRVAFWSNATEISSKVALKSGFEWCCKHASYYKNF